MVKLGVARCWRAWVLVCGLPLAGAAQAATDITLSALADDDGGANYDAYVSIVPNKFWSLSANIGHTTSSDRFSDFSGVSYGASTDLHSERFGARLALRGWKDSNQFSSRTAAGKFYWKHAGFELGLLLEQKDFDVDYSFVPNIPPGNTRPVTRTASFAGDGAGLAVSWYGDTWGGYAQYLDYSYDRRLNLALQTLSSTSPTLRPALEAIVRSVVTRASSVTDNEISVGVDRSFVRSGLRLDAYRLRDAISQGDSTGVSLGWRYSISPKVATEATVGATDSEGYDTQLYGGLAVTFRL